MGYVLKELELLVLSGAGIMGEVAVREINHDVRALTAKTAWALIEKELLRKGPVLIRGVEVNISLELSPNGDYHQFSWSFWHAGRGVQESVLYWDENFDYGPSEDSGSDDDAMEDIANGDR